jgi:hypothetical protein
MSRLPLVPEAYPLRSSNALDRLYYPPLVDGSTWDATLSSMCVCDSSWSVGLGEGETQLAEYFGPACEFRRCPSGDDPTTADDETDCEGIAQDDSLIAGVGVAGNLCHYECSGRGLCNHRNGVCTCFPGVTGVNCGSLIKPLIDTITV